jgi:hypothetical protein
MSEDIQTLQRFAYKSFGGVLSDGYVLFAKNWLNIIGPIASFSFIAIIINNILFADLGWLSPQVGVILNKFLTDINTITEVDMQIILHYALLNLGRLIIGAIFTVIAMCSVSSYLLKKYKGVEVDFIKEFRSSFKSRLLIVLLLIGIIVPLGIVLLYIPSIFIIGFYIFSIFTYKKQKESIKEARFIAKGSFWKIIGVFLIPIIIVFTINSLFQMFLDFIIPIDETTFLSWYNPTSRNYGMIILYDFLYNNFINILLGPLFICFLTVLYISSKAKKLTISQRKEQPVSVKYRYSEPVTSRLYSNKIEAEKPRLDHKFNSGLYCPYCGKFMEKKFEKCPYCNEPLDFNF